jgi:hypothetical protein
MTKIGRCRLTGSSGPFVRAHILPRAFTDRNLAHSSRVEWGDFDRPPMLRHTSWYDERIVTNEGEAILAEYDNYAAKIFLENGLVWRNFPPKEGVERSEAIGDWGLELIKVRGLDTKKLRLFFLSILWRSSVSKRMGFENVELPASHLERLRQIVAGEMDGEMRDFPVVLILMTTRGEAQNHTPIKDEIDMSEIDSTMDNLPIFRIWLDGLIAHIGQKPKDEKCFRVWENRVLGNQSDLLMIGRRYEGSKQDQMLDFFRTKMEEHWPRQSSAIYGVING